MQVVLAAPVARAAAPHLGPTGLPLLAGAIGTGIFSGSGGSWSSGTAKTAAPGWFPLPSCVQSEGVAAYSS